MKRFGLYVLTLLSLFLGGGETLFADWSAPMQVSPGPSAINLPLHNSPLVINSNSVALVGWLNGTFGVGQTISSSTLPPRFSGWSTPLNVFTNTQPGFTPTFPTMASDIFGGSTSAWGTLNSLVGLVQVSASYRNSTTEAWPAPVTNTVNGNPGSSDFAPGDLGNIAAIFALSATNTPPWNIIVDHLHRNAQNWYPAILLGLDESANPSVTAHTLQGNTIFAWKMQHNSSLTIQSTRFSFVTHMFSPFIDVPLPIGTTDVNGLDVTIDAVGNATLIYEASIGSKNLLYASILQAGENTAWSNPILVSDPTNSVVGATVDATGVDVSTILWGEAVTNTQQFIRASSLLIDGSLTFVTNLTDPNALNTQVSPSHVTMDLFGNAAGAWTVSNGGTSQVQVSSKPANQDWATPETLSTTGQEPAVALSDQGTAVAIWLDSNTSVLFSSRNLFLFPLQPPSGFVGRVIKDKFSKHTDYFLKMKWEPSPAPNITSYKIYKNGNRIAMIPGNGPFTFTQPLDSAQLDDVYTLVATASNGNESTPIPLAIQRKIKVHDYRCHSKH